MKYLLKIGLYITAVSAVICCKDDDFQKFSVEKPVSIALQEEINAYDPLKSYIGENFTLGAAVSVGDYNNQGAMYRLINSNFEEVTAGYGMKHGAVVQADGSLALGSVENFLSNANDAGLSVYGHALMWHANQNAEYLNGTIAPTIIPPTGGPVWDVVTRADFETDDASNYQSNGPNAELSFTADGEGADGEGRALKILNSEVREFDYSSQLFVTFSEVTEVGQKYRLEMDVRADDAASAGTQAQTAPGAYKFYDFFGAINFTSDWQHISVEITIDDNTSACNTIAFNLGNTATSYYFDNLEVAKFNESGGGPAYDPLTEIYFETDGEPNYQSNGPNAEFSFTADGGGANNEGRALKILNAEVRANDYGSQIFITFAPMTEVGQQFKLEMDIRADDAASIGTQAQTAPGAYKFYDFFGTINATTEWQHISVERTINDNTSLCTTIAFNLGNTATTYYFDNVVISWLNENAGGETIIEKTPEEKRDTLASEMERWISGMMEVSKDYVKAWDVVNEPMDDGSPSEVKTGVGKELAADEFYWQDYFGKDYAVLAFNLARQYGNADDLLFINDYNLEYNLDKCRGLIDYVEYIEEQGATVDGIGTQMHIGIDSDKDKIAEMFQLLAASGKMIKVSELDVRVYTTAPTEEILQEQADMYKYVVDMYEKYIPASQRYGITVWGITDSSEDSTWLPDERQGLWNIQLTRKPAYVGFAEGLKGF